VDIDLTAGQKSDDLRLSASTRCAARCKYVHRPSWLDPYRSARKKGHITKAWLLAALMVSPVWS